VEPIRYRHVYATGIDGTYTQDRAKAFVFADAVVKRASHPNDDGETWALAHLECLRRLLPKRERGHLVLELVESET
jgi:hypothetical protein